MKTNEYFSLPRSFFQDTQFAILHCLSNSKHFHQRFLSGRLGIAAQTAPIGGASRSHTVVLHSHRSLSLRPSPEQQVEEYAPRVYVPSMDLLCYENSNSNEVKAYEDPVLLQERVLTNMLKTEDQYTLTSRTFPVAQNEVTEAMVKVVAEWMMEVRDLHEE